MNDDGEVKLVGPFETTHVVIDGWRVPHLTAHPANGGIVSLTLDDRFGLDLPVAMFDQVATFIADAIAVAKGYTCHPRAGWEGPVTAQPFARMQGIDFLPAEDPERP